jgi:chromate reductase
MTERLRALLVNGAIRDDGNTAGLLAIARSAFVAHDVDVDELVLCRCDAEVDGVVDRVRAADVLLFGTGVYWGSWGSPLQRFLEVLTAWEMTDVFVGKSAGVVATMDSVGGSDVVARLFFALSCLGCSIPAGGSVVVSRTGLAVRGRPGFDDVWQPADVDVLVENLLALARARPRFACWPVERTGAPSGRWPAHGPLDLGVPHYLSSTTEARSVDDDGA